MRREVSDPGLVIHGIHTVCHVRKQDILALQLQLHVILPVLPAEQEAGFGLALRHFQVEINLVVRPVFREMRLSAGNPFGTRPTAVHQARFKPGRGRCRVLCGIPDRYGPVVAGGGFERLAAIDHAHRHVALPHVRGPDRASFGRLLHLDAERRLPLVVLFAGHLPAETGFGHVDTERRLQIFDLKAVKPEGFDGLSSAGHQRQRQQRKDSPASHTRCTCSITRRKLPPAM